MKKRIGLALAVSALMTLWAGAAGATPKGPPDGAAGPPSGGCPAGAGWKLVTPTPGHLSAEWDLNGDGLVCVYFLPVPDAGGITFMDNVVKA